MSKYTDTLHLRVRDIYTNPGQSETSMDVIDTPHQIIASLALIVIGYQIYFIPQNFPIRDPDIGEVTSMDRKIPFNPKWVWTYIFLFYPTILTPILVVDNLREMIIICGCHAALLVTHVSIAYLRPVRTPPSWRSFPRKSSPSHKFLKFIQKFDKGNNCFPSMHVAISTTSAIDIFYYMSNIFGIYAIFVVSIPVVISLSTLFTKQHFVADVVFGVVLGIFVYCGFYQSIGYMDF